MACQVKSALVTLCGLSNRKLATYLSSRLNTLKPLSSYTAYTTSLALPTLPHSRQLVPPKDQILAIFPWVVQAIDLPLPLERNGIQVAASRQGHHVHPNLQQCLPTAVGTLKRQAKVGL